MAEIPHSESQPHHHRRHRAATTHHLSPPPSGVTPSEFHPLIPAIINFHTYTLTPEVNQCSSLLVQKIHAPRAAVWSILRRFDMPQLYKHFIKRCSVREGCKIAVGALRDVDVISGLPAATSTERLDILDDEGFVFGFSIIGGDHRLRNYRSVTTLHDLRGGNDSNEETETVVLESYVVDVPEGNTEEDTRLFADTVVKLNLQKLATAAVGVARDSHN